MPGGAAAIHEPWRRAVSYLAQHFGPAFLDLPLEFVKRLDPGRTEVLLRMIERGVNSPSPRAVAGSSTPCPPSRAPGRR
jgi:hydrogenase maturation factor HypF (carbamoyltransferase family)